MRVSISRARAETEAVLRRRMPNITILRHGKSSAATLRLGLVTIAQMLEALADGVERPPIDEQVLDVPALRGH